MKFNSTIETEDYAKFMKHIDDGCEWNVLMYDSDTNLIAKLPHVSVVSFIDEDDCLDLETEDGCDITIILPKVREADVQYVSRTESNEYKDCTFDFVTISGSISFYSSVAA